MHAVGDLRSAPVRGAASELLAARGRADWLVVDLHAELRDVSIQSSIALADQVEPAPVIGTYVAAKADCSGGTNELVSAASATTAAAASPRILLPDFICSLRAYSTE